MEIVYDQKGETFVALEAAGLCAAFQDADGAGVVEPEGGGRDGNECFGGASPVFAAEMAGAEFVGVDLSYGGYEALEQGFLRHFQAEDGYWLACADADIFGEVEGQRGFSLRGAGGQDQELGRLQAGG